MGLFNLGRKTITPKVAVGLTELGKKKAEEFSTEGPKFDILTTLNEEGPSSIDDIAESTRINSGKVRLIVKSLIRAGYVRAVGE